MTWNRKLKSRTESDRCDRTRIGSGTSTAWLDLDSLAGPVLVSRIDVIGLFLDPELELMFSSRTDVVGLVLDPGPRLLGWILGGTSTAWLDLDSLAGPELVSRIDVIGLFLDPEQELMCSSRT